MTQYDYDSRFSSDFSLFRFRAARRSWSEKKWPHLILNLSLGVFSFDQCQETKASHIWNAPSLKHPCKGSRTILLSRMPEIQTTPKDLFGFHFGGFSKSLNPCRRKQFRIDVLSWISFAPQLSLLKSLWSVDNIWNKSLYTQCANVIVACTNYFRQIE